MRSRCSTGRRFVIHTPLMWIDKAATFGLAQDSAVSPSSIVLFEETHTCSLGDRSAGMIGVWLRGLPAAGLRADACQWMGKNTG